MFAEAISFEPSSREDDFIYLFPTQILCVRQSARALEFLRVRSNGSTGVVCVEGDNLGVLLREMFAGLRTRITTGVQMPLWTRCQVTKITQRLGWIVPKLPMALDPNPTPKHLFQFETGRTRDFWRHEALQAFCAPRFGNKTQLLMQFNSKHAYVLHTLEDTYSKRLKEIKADNFRFTMQNRFSTLLSNPYPPCTLMDVTRFTFAKIVYEEKNFAAKSEWEVLIEFRSSAPTVAPQAMER